MVSESDKNPSKNKTVDQAENMNENGSERRSNKKVQNNSNNGRRRYLGVRQRASGRWVAEIKHSSQKLRLWLGTFDKAEEAALAYDNAARVLRGKNAKTNFEHQLGSSSWNDLIGKVNPRVYQLLQLTIIKNYHHALKSLHGNHYTLKQVGHFDTVVEDTIFCSSTTTTSDHLEPQGGNYNNKLSLGNSRVYSSVVVAPSFSSSSCNN